MFRRLVKLEECVRQHCARASGVFLFMYVRPPLCAFGTKNDSAYSMTWIRNMKFVLYAKCWQLAVRNARTIIKSVTFVVLWFLHIKPTRHVAHVKACYFTIKNYEAEYKCLHSAS